MKRSLNVATPLLASAAVTLLTACRNPQMQRCVDDQNRVVDDKFCRNQPTQPNGMTGPGIGTNYVPFHYYYGGGGGYGFGSVATGGSFTATPGASYSTTRGGFGSTFSGGEGGHGSAGGGGGE